MKNFYRLILAAATMFAAASCAENLETDSSEVNVGNMVFSSVVDETPVSKTTYTSQKVFWEAEDHITVFAVSDETLASDFKATKLSEDKTTATFEGVSDLNCETYYAVYPHSSSNAFDAQTGKLTVSLPAVQTAVPEGFESGANVSVACSNNVGEGNQGSLQFRNVTTLVCLKFDSLDDALNTKSITVRAKKNDEEYWGLAGTAQVQIGEDGIPVVGEGSETYVTLSAPADGFKTGVVYYVPVYAVGASTGLEVTFKAVNDEDYVKTNDTAAELTRNWLFSIGAVPEPYPFALPDDFEVPISFKNGWPFYTPFVESQTTSGETYYYAYQYEYNGKNVYKCLPVKIKSITGKDYYMKENGLFFQTAQKGHIYSPAIENRYLTSFQVSKHTTGRLNLNGELTAAYALGYADFRIYADKTTGHAKDGSPILDADKNNFATTAVKSEREKSYYVKMRDKSMTLYEIVLTYSKTAPGNAPAAE